MRTDKLNHVVTWHSVCLTQIKLQRKHLKEGIDVAWVLTNVCNSIDYILNRLEVCVSR